MSLLNYYIEQSLNKEWFTNYANLADGNSANTYEYKNTNLRYLKSYLNDLTKIEDIIDKPRENWPIHADYKQEVHKHYIVKMREAKIIYEFNKIYKFTQKGIIYKKLRDSSMSDDEKWIINYLFLIDGYFKKIDNYVFHKTDKINDKITSIFSVDDLNYYLQEFISKINSISNLDKAFRYDITYILSFWDDVSFLESYKYASKESKEEFFDYIINNRNNGNCNSNPISKKYEKSGNYNLQMLKEDIKVFYLSSLIINKNLKSIQEAENFIINLYSKYFSINKEKVFEFISSFQNVFDVIFTSVFKLDSTYNDDEIGDNLESFEEFEIIAENLAEERIDDTTSEGRREIQSIFTQRKRIARERDGYKCELESLNSCKYFTSKSTNKNYVEIHHLIPREFRNDFEYSIEVLANYITLCPNCHKELHLAVDRERIKILRYLYNKRLEDLKRVKLEINEKTLLSYYEINE